MITTYSNFFYFSAFSNYNIFFLWLSFSFLSFILLSFIFHSFTFILITLAEWIRVLFLIEENDSCFRTRLVFWLILRLIFSKKNFFFSYLKLCKNSPIRNFLPMFLGLAPPLILLVFSFLRQKEKNKFKSLFFCCLL